MQANHQRAIFGCVVLSLIAVVIVTTASRGPASARPSLVAVAPLVELADTPAEETLDPADASDSSTLSPVDDSGSAIYDGGLAELAFTASPVEGTPATDLSVDIGVAAAESPTKVETEPLANTAPQADAAATHDLSDDGVSAEDIVTVEHTVSRIPDPPDVGASDARETFEIAQPDDSYDPWKGVRICESHDTYDINTGNGFYGAYQFTLSTWDWVAGLIDRPDLIGVRPDQASSTDQDRLAQALGFEVAGGGLQHWPVCGRFYG